MKNLIIHFFTGFLALFVLSSCQSDNVVEKNIVEPEIITTRIYSGSSSVKITNWTSLSSSVKKKVKDALRRINIAQVSRDRGFIYRIKIDEQGTVYQSEEWEYRDRTASILANIAAIFVGGLPVWLTGNDESEGSIFLRDLIDSPMQIEINVQQSGITQTVTQDGVIRVNWNIRDSRLINESHRGQIRQRPSPLDVTLFHELVHAIHIADRRDQEGYISHEVNMRVNVPLGSSYFLGHENILREEYNTVGFGVNNDRAYTENNYRSWTARPPRASYTNERPTPCVGACSDPQCAHCGTRHHDELK